jgi:type III pantothenate kinase
MIVAIDAGNTRTKWGVFDAAGKMVSHGAVDNNQLDRLAAESMLWKGCRRLVLSNVAGAFVADRIGALCNDLKLPLLTVTAKAAACGVTNGYAQPEQLGADRWAALIAAWNHYHVPCVVATAGTALTVDALSSKGEFLGGLIVPGWRMMQAALTSTAAGLTAQQGELQDFPRNTGDAMASGAWLAMAGAVERTCHAMQAREGMAPRCILSGGDAHQLLAALSSPARIADNLVLHGLWLIEREHA